MDVHAFSHHLLLLLLLSRFSCVWLCDPIPGILQARTLEWVAISFSNAWKWKVKVKSLSRARLLATTWTAAYQAPLSMGFSKQEYWSGLPLPSQSYYLTKQKSRRSFQMLWNYETWNYSIPAPFNFDQFQKAEGDLLW